MFINVLFLCSISEILLQFRRQLPRYYNLTHACFVEPSDVTDTHRVNSYAQKRAAELGLELSESGVMRGCGLRRPVESKKTRGYQLNFSIARAGS
jgi:hypothetical protein